MSLGMGDITSEQDAAITRLVDEDETLLIAGLGFGKAIVGLTALHELIELGHLHRVLVLAPLRVAQLTWGTEPAKWDHIPNDLVAIACGTPKQRQAALDSDAPVVVTNFENVSWILDQAGDTFDGLLIDEMSKLKAVGGKAPRKLRHFAKKVIWRCGMTGTPVSESGTDIYSQALLLDLGKALGTLKESFKRKYFYPEDYQNRKWRAFPGSLEQIAKALEDLVFMADDAGYKAALPPVVDRVITLEMPERLREMYDEMDGTGVVVFEPSKVITAGSAGIRSIKLHAMAAGGLYGKDKDGKSELWYFDDYKLQELRRVMIGLLDEGVGPVIICYQYGFELAGLREMFPEAPVLGDGQRVTADLIDTWNAGAHPVLLMHHASAAHGLNLQAVCRTIIHLSPVWGSDPWAQCLGRIRRRGQPAEFVTRIILVAHDSRDGDALAGIEVKKENEYEMMGALRGAK